MISRTPYKGLDSLEQGELLMVIAQTLRETTGLQDGV